MDYIRTEPNAGRRAAATLIDYIVIAAFSIWFIMTFGEPNETGGKTVSGAPALVPMLFWFIWLVVPEAYYGTTLGHQIMGLKVISFDGDKISFGQALKRRICDALEISWCFGLIAFILIKNTQYHQRLGDIVAKTLVIDKKESLTPNEFEFENPDQ